LHEDGKKFNSPEVIMNKAVELATGKVKAILID
jgi:hypothetical protein